MNVLGTLFRLICSWLILLILAVYLQSPAHIAPADFVGCFNTDTLLPLVSTLNWVTITAGILLLLALLRIQEIVWNVAYAAAFILFVGFALLFGVGDVESMLCIREKFPDARVLAFFRNPDDIEDFAENGVDFIRLWERWLTEENVRRVKACGVELWIMTGGPETDLPVGRPDRDSLVRLMKWEPDGLLVNDIPFVRSVLREL